MKPRSSRVVAIFLVSAALVIPFLVARAAGGRIEGKVTDPKGAAVVGAAITVTDPVTNQTFTAVTDGQGNYKIGGLAAGTYSLTISASGFSESRRDEVKVEEGAVATVDVMLEIAAVEAAVTVTAPGVKPNSDSLYQQLRQLGKRQDFDGPYATVTDLVLERDAASFVLHSGEIYFAPEVRRPRHRAQCSLVREKFHSRPRPTQKSTASCSSLNSRPSRNRSPD